MSKLGAGDSLLRWIDLLADRLFNEIRGYVTKGEARTHDRAGRSAHDEVCLREVDAAFG